MAGHVVCQAVRKVVRPALIFVATQSRMDVKIGPTVAHSDETTPLSAGHTSPHLVCRNVSACPAVVWSQPTMLSKIGLI